MIFIANYWGETSKPCFLLLKKEAFQKLEKKNIEHYFWNESPKKSAPRGHAVIIIRQIIAVS